MPKDVRKGSKTSLIEGKKCMRKIVKVIKIAILQIVLSSTILLIAAELLPRVVFPWLPTFGSFYPRYRVDNFRANTIGYFNNDPIMPFSLKPNFSHALTDFAWYPKSFKVSLDKYGYRNDKILDHYADVIVGDSFAFGFGVDNDQTISSLLNRHESTYNLAIPGAGPEMYMAMIESFLNRSETNRITILFFTGNDFDNLNGSYWQGMEKGKPPDLHSRIERDDTSSMPENPGLIYYAPIIRDSYLAMLIYTTTIPKELKNLNEKLLYKQYKVVSEFAIAEADKVINYKEKITYNKNIALKYLKELYNHNRNTNSDIKIKISWLIERVETGRIRNIFPVTKNVVQSFINSGCEPIGSEFSNLLSKTNYYAGYYYAELSSAQSWQYKGTVKNFVSLLQHVKKKYGQLSHDARKLINHLRRMDSWDQIRTLSEKIKDALPNNVDMRNTISQEDKIQIFLKYLAGLNKSGRKVEIFTVPSENLLQSLYANRRGDRGLCDKASDYGIPCHDLTPFFLDHYSNKANNALFSDGSHLNIEGNEKVADWILKVRCQ